jgi:hypothetical protein
LPAAIADLARMSVDYPRSPLPIRCSAAIAILWSETVCMDGCWPRWRPTPPSPTFPVWGTLAHHFAADRIVEAVDELMSLAPRPSSRAA